MVSDHFPGRGTEAQNGEHTRNPRRSFALFRDLVRDRRLGRCGFLRRLRVACLAGWGRVCGAGNIGVLLGACLANRNSNSNRNGNGNGN